MSYLCTIIWLDFWPCVCIVTKDWFYLVQSACLEIFKLFSHLCSKLPFVCAQQNVPIVVFYCDVLLKVCVVASNWRNGKKSCRGTVRDHGRVYTESRHTHVTRCCLHVTFSTMFSTMFSTRVLACDVQHKSLARDVQHDVQHNVQHESTCTWRSAREYLHVTFSTRVLHVTFSTMYNTMFSTRVLAHDVQHGSFCMWRSAQEYLHVMFSMRVLAHEVQHKNTCTWRSAQEYFHVTFSMGVLPCDVQHGSTSTWCSAWEYLQVTFSTRVRMSSASSM